jgi:ATP synthase protein I
MQAYDAPIHPRILRGAAIATGAITPVALGVSAAVAGTAGVAGSAAGIATVALFFTISLVALARVGAHLLLPAALGVYAGKIVALGVVLHVAGDVAFLDHLALGWSAFAAIVVWLTTEVVLLARAKVLYVQPEPSGGPRPGVGG